MFVDDDSVDARVDRDDNDDDSDVGGCWDADWGGTLLGVFTE